MRSVARRMSMPCVQVTGMRVSVAVSEPVTSARVQVTGVPVSCSAPMPAVAMAVAVPAMRQTANSHYPQSHRTGHERDEVNIHLQHIQHTRTGGQPGRPASLVYGRVERPARRSD